MVITIDAIEQASRNLGQFVTERATEIADKIGFGYRPTPYAPSTYSELVKAHRKSAMSGRALPVSNLHSEGVIYPGATTNYAMRFWHDCLHVETGLTFNLDDELELGLYHLRLATLHGMSRDSLEWQMMRIDMLGQNYLLGIAGHFPYNQRQFVVDCLAYGLDEGVLMEARRGLAA